ncbi:MAG: GAF domain-containing protein, partial [Anaerolineales bacterium]
AENSHLVPSDKILTDLGEESLRYQRLLYKHAETGEPAALAVPTSYRDKAQSLLLEILDNQESRRWSEDELLLVEQIADQLSLALENAQLFEQIQLRADELSILRQVSLELTREQHDLQSVLDIINQRAIELLNAENAATWIWDANLSRLELKSIYLSAADTLQTASVTPKGELPELVFRSRKTQVLQDYAPWRYRSEMQALNLPAPAVALPLEWQGQAAGVLLLCRAHSAPVFEPNEVHLAELYASQAAAVIQNALLFNQTQSALQETDLLYRASAELNASLSYQDILDTLRQYTLLGAQAYEVSINIYDRHWDEKNAPEWFDQVSRWSAESGMEETPHRYAISTNPYASRILKSTSPTLIEDIMTDSRLGTAAREMYLNRYAARGILFAPLVSAGQWIGHITAIYQQPARFEEPAIRRLSALTGQAAFAVQNLRLLDESRRRADELQTAAEIARDTSGTLSLDTLLNRAAQLIREKFSYYHAAIFLLDERGAYAYPRATTSKLNEGLGDSQSRIAVGSNSVIGYVTQVGEHLLVNDISQDPLRFTSPLLPETRSELGIPLKIGDRVIGALDVQSTRVNAFTLNDISVLQILADQLAVAVGNARSYEISLQAMEEMRKADQLKSQFLANMSHELRTPLNSIIGFSRVILKGIDGPVNDTQQQDLQAIYSSGQHLLSLINDILDLSKIEAGKMELSFDDEVDIGELVNSTLSTAKGLVKDKPIEIVCEIEPDLPSTRADPLKIRQVLLNLISNAAKFTDQGSITIKVEQQMEDQKNRRLKVSVTDTGQGIAPEDQKKLFLPFSQVDASPTRKTGGSGLGLSICRHLIDMHQGEIGVHSQIGTGSTFFFVLPVGAASSQERKAEPLLPTKTILCIDSDPDVIQLYQRYLLPHGYKVLPYTDPDQAFDAARNIQPLAITLDIALSSGDGWAVLQWLKKDPFTEHIPVIICSIKDEKPKAAASGAHSYLLKPILEEDLVSSIRKLETPEN